MHISVDLPYYVGTLKGVLLQQGVPEYLEKVLGKSEAQHFSHQLDTISKSFYRDALPPHNPAIGLIE